MSGEAMLQFHERAMLGEFLHFLRTQRGLEGALAGLDANAEVTAYLAYRDGYLRRMAEQGFPMEMHAAETVQRAVDLFAGGEPRKEPLVVRKEEV